MTDKQFQESVNAEIRRMTNKAKPYPAADCQFDCNNFLNCNRCGLPMEDHNPQQGEPTSFSEWLEQNNDSIDIGGNEIPDRVQANHDQYDNPLPF